jgi:hypothetical protein
VTKSADDGGVALRKVVYIFFRLTFSSGGTSVIFVYCVPMVVFAVVFVVVVSALGVFKLDDATAMVTPAGAVFGEQEGVET